MSEFWCDYIKPIASSHWAAVPCCPQCEAVRHPQSRLAALCLSSPEAECCYSRSLIKTPDRISEKPPRGGLSILECGRSNRSIGGASRPLPSRLSAISILKGPTSA